MTHKTQTTACAQMPYEGIFVYGSYLSAQAFKKEHRLCLNVNQFSLFLGQGQVFGRDKTDTRTLGIIQLMILNRIKANPENATARKITDDLSKIFGERIPDAQVFVTLSRLRGRGLVNAATPKLTSERANPNGDEGEISSLETTALPLKSSAKSRGRRAAIMELTPQGVAAVKQAALLLSDSADKSLKGDIYAKTTTIPTKDPMMG
jgi:hypothetical protein